MIYNFPTVTSGIDLDSDTLIALGQHPNIVGAKLSCGNVGKLTRVVAALSYTMFTTFPGKADVFLPSLLVGGAGLIGALPNIAPKVHVKLLRSFMEAKIGEAVGLQRLLSDADWEMGKLGGSVAGIKATIVKHWGYGTTVVRGPLGSVGVEKVEEAGRLEELVALEKSL